MFEIELPNHDSIRPVKIYHRWDIKEEDIVTFDNIKAEHRERYLELDDGSGWYVKVYGVNDYSISTGIGMLRREDYVHQGTLRPVGTFYSGVKKGSQHELVAPYKKWEIALAKTVVSKGYKPRWTERIKMLTLEELQRVADNKDIKAEWFIDRIKDEAENPNATSMGRLKAIGILARIMGTEIEKPITNDRPLLSATINIRQNRRQALPDNKDMEELLTNILDVEHTVVEEEKDA